MKCTLYKMDFKIPRWRTLAGDPLRESGLWPSRREKKVCSHLATLPSLIRDRHLGHSPKKKSTRPDASPPEIYSHTTGRHFCNLALLSLAPALRQQEKT